VRRGRLHGLDIMVAAKTLLFLALTGVSAAALAAEAEDTPPAPSVFVSTAVLDGMTEIELGKLAQRQAQDPAVKDFGARMVKDHTAAGEKLKPIADAKGIVLPSGIDKSHQKDVDKLAKKSGADFDKAFMDHMVTDHRKVVKEFQKEAKSAKDADVQQFASSTLPTIEEHLRLAQQIHPIK
jgi:putative membrane protein